MVKSISRAITVAEQDMLIRKVDRLLSRQTVMPRKPIDPVVLRNLYVETMLPDERAAWNAMSSWYVGLASPPPFVRAATTNIPVQFACGSVMALQLSGTTFDRNLWPLWSRTSAPPAVEAREILSDVHYAQFLAWANESLSAATRLLHTYVTLVNIVQIAASTGQLYRMAPELLRMYSPGAAANLKEAARRSPLPEAWMKIPRGDVYDSIDYLNLCRLMPPLDPTSGVERYSSKIYQDDWVFDWHTLPKMSSLPSRIGLHGRIEFDVYDWRRPLT